MTLSFPSPEFDDAVAAVCHGSATEAEMHALNALLLSNSSARDEYLMRVELHTRLASEPDLFSQAADAAASASARTSLLLVAGTTGFREKTFRRSSVPMPGRRQPAAASAV